jgi:hypothetical protein
MQSGWSTIEQHLIGPPVAVFNRATLHQRDNGSLVLIGINSKTPSAPLQRSANQSAIIWADLQEDARCPTLLAVGYADDTISIFNAVNGERAWNGSAMGTATGILVRNMLVIASDSEVMIKCWALEGSTHKSFSVANPVICRYGSHLCVCSTKGTKLYCTVTDVMSLTLDTTVLFEIPMQMGPPLSMVADVMRDKRAFIRIICGNGIVVCHPGGISHVPGDYSQFSLKRNRPDLALTSACADERSTGECGIFVAADGAVMLLASLATPGVDVLSIDGRLQDTLWPAKQGDTTICVKAVSSHSGFFSNVKSFPFDSRRVNSNCFCRELYYPK